MGKVKNFFKGFFTIISVIGGAILAFILMKKNNAPSVEQEKVNEIIDEKVAVKVEEIKKETPEESFEKVAPEVKEVITKENKTIKEKAVDSIVDNIMNRIDQEKDK